MKTLFLTSDPQTGDGSGLQTSTKQHQDAAQQRKQLFVHKRDAACEKKRKKKFAERIHFEEFPC